MQLNAAANADIKLYGWIDYYEACFTFSCRFESAYGCSEFATFKLIFPYLIYLCTNTTTVLNLRSIERYFSNSKVLLDFYKKSSCNTCAIKTIWKRYSRPCFSVLYPASIRLAFNTATCGWICQVACECYCYWKKSWSLKEFVSIIIVERQLTVVSILYNEMTNCNQEAQFLLVNGLIHAPCTLDQAFNLLVGSWPPP